MLIIMEKQKEKRDNSKKEIFCVFCLNVLNEGNFTEVEESIKGILDILFLTLTAEITRAAIMCDDCSVKLFAAFDFKTKCVETEDCIFPYLNCGKYVDLREVYLNERAKEHVNILSEDDKICRLCMEVVTCGFTPIKEDVHTFCGYIPEVNFSSTKEPVICRVCFDLLGTHTKFLKSCLETKERIKGVYEDKNSKSVWSVKHEEIEVKSEANSDSETQDFRIKSVDTPKATIPEVTKRTTSSKLEECSRDDYKRSPAVEKDPIELTPKEKKERLKGMYFCGKCNFRTKEEEILKYHNRLHGKNKVKTYDCDECDFKTSVPHWFVRHKLRHHNSPTTYKCDMCDYTTHSQRSLRDHVATHTRKKWKCSLCKLQTNNRTTLTQHARRHKTPGGIPTYKCEYSGCEFKTIYKRNIQKHLSNHQTKILKCDACDFQTHHKSALTQHGKRHRTPEELQTHKCEYSDCQFKTIHKYTFEIHLSTHKKQETAGPNSAQKSSKKR